VSKMPGTREVDRAIKQTAREVKTALKEINHQAGKLVARGEYAAAEELVKVGRAITIFAGEVDALQLRWRELQDNAPGKLSSERTPLWEYYRPILQALVQLDGESTLARLEEKVEPLLTSVLQSGEMTLMSGDKLSWKRAVRRARRHMVKEGFLEEHSGLRWKISDSGRRVAEEVAALK
jgi:hypothetical protein